MTKHSDKEAADAKAAEQAAADEAARKAEQERLANEAKQKEADEKAAQERKAAEQRAAQERTGKAATLHQTGVMQQEVLRATMEDAAERAREVDEANRAAQEEASKRDAEARKREAEDAARLQSYMPGAAGPDPKGRADGAANYDPPILNPQPGTPEFHLAHPGEITSGSFAPRDQSAEEFHEARKSETESDNAYNGPAGAQNEARLQANARREAQARKARA